MPSHAELPAPSGRQVAAPTGRAKWILVTLFVFAQFLAMAGVSIYLPSLPDLSSVFGVGNPQLQLTLTVYLLSFAGAQIPFGMASDRFGRKPLLGVALGLSALGSIVVLGADSYSELVVGRCLQGAAASGVSTLVKAVGGDLYSGRELQAITSLLGIVVVLGPVASPVLGAYLHTGFGWRAPFVFLLVLAVVIAVGLFLCLPESSQRAAVSGDWARRLAVTFRRPFHNPVFLRNVLIFSMLVTIDLSYNAVSTFFYQHELGFSPVEFAWLSAVLGAAMALGILTGRRMQGRSPHWLGGGAIVLATLALFAGQLAFPRTVYALLVPSTLFSYGMGVLFPYAFARAIDAVERDVGFHAAFFGTVQMSLACLATAYIAWADDTNLIPFGCVMATASLVLVVASWRDARSLTRPPAA